MSTPFSAIIGHEHYESVVQLSYFLEIIDDLSYVVIDALEKPSDLNVECQKLVALPRPCPRIPPLPLQISLDVRVRAPTTLELHVPPPGVVRRLYQQDQVPLNVPTAEGEEHRGRRRTFLDNAGCILEVLGAANAVR